MKAFPISRFIVSDNSMIPLFYPGDHVLTFNWVVPKENDAIVFRMADKFFIKRVRRVKEKKFICSGDSKKYSKTNYTITLPDIVGKVLLKY